MLYVHMHAILNQYNRNILSSFVCIYLYFCHGFPQCNPNTAHRICLLKHKATHIMFQLNILKSWHGSIANGTQGCTCLHSLFLYFSCIICTTSSFSVFQLCCPLAVSWICQIISYLGLCIVILWHWNVLFPDILWLFHLPPSSLCFTSISCFYLF